MSKKYSITTKVWRWPGDMGWHFVSLDEKMSEEIKKKHGANFYGSGFLKIRATLNKISWDTALFPYTAQKIYLLSIKKKIRQQARIMEGDTIAVSFELV